MADDYINPIDEKMMGYANRMRDLILEAYADGIILTATPHPEEQYGVLGENQRMRRMMTVVPEMDYTHAFLRKPYEVSAKAVIEISQSIVSPTKLDLPKSWRINPVWRAESARFFVDTAFVTPWVVGDGEYETSALRFGAAMDLLALSYFHPLAREDKLHHTDIVDPEVSLDSIFYRPVNGDSILQAKVSLLPGAKFFSRDAGNYQELAVAFDFQLPGGSGLIRVAGTLSRHLGTLSLQAASDNPEVVPFGFTLDATRSRPKQCK